MKRSCPFRPLVVVFAVCSSLGASRPADLPVVYHGARYGFTFRLPASWRGYTVKVARWQENSGMTDESGKHHPRCHGPMLIFRHPGWTGSNPYHDIPIHIFTRRQWKENRGEFDLYAGGVEDEIAHNSKYVFGIHSRFNFDEDTRGADEVGKIVGRNIDAHVGKLPPAGDG